MCLQSNASLEPRQYHRQSDLMTLVQTRDSHESSNPLRPSRESSTIACGKSSAIVPTITNAVGDGMNRKTTPIERGEAGLSIREHFKMSSSSTVEGLASTAISPFARWLLSCQHHQSPEITREFIYSPFAQFANPGSLTSKLAAKAVNSDAGLSRGKVAIGPTTISAIFYQRPDQDPIPVLRFPHKQTGCLRSPMTYILYTIDDDEVTTLRTRWRA